MNEDFSVLLTSIGVTPFIHGNEAPRYPLGHDGANGVSQHAETHRVGEAFGPIVREALEAFAFDGQ